VSEDASASYRGYRKQALYALWRIFTDSDASHIYRPEGAEDLAVYDAAQALIEVVQVKAYSGPLSLAAFKPGSSRGFFARMVLRRKAHSECVHAIATYGPVGPELQGAIDGDSDHRESVIRKLTEQNSTLSESDAILTLEALRNNVHQVDEGSMRSAIVERLSTTVAGGDVEGALGLLLFWMFDAAENRRDVTRDLLERQIERIGAHLAQLRDGSSEWMATVHPVRDEVIEEVEQARLRTEYRRGAHASWKHILADADCPRENLLQEIHEKFLQSAAVVVRGASGQGKSSLGWRYLRDYTADGLRFSVRVVEGRAHAMRIAHLLRGHAKSLRLPPIVYLDVSPADTGWTELLQPLVEENIKVLVTVREEDLARAGGGVEGAAVSEVLLDRLSREDAERIYETLATDVERHPALDFEDIWAKFGSPEGGPPLLEFAHLVFEGEELKTKIARQILRVQLEAGQSSSALTVAHLALLALCAVANAADCRVDVQRLCAETGLDVLARPFALFENEYMLRVSDSTRGSYVGSVHPLRSRSILAALLRDRPEAWIDLALRVLPLLVDSDLEAFLLMFFSRHSEHSARMTEALLAMSLGSWTQASGITRALLWEGVNTFEKANRDVFASAIKQYGAGWWMLADLVIGGRSGSDLRATLAKSFGSAIQPITLPPATQLFAPFEAWVQRASPPASLPGRSSDWLGAGDVAFWIGLTGSESAMRVALTDLLLNDIPDDLGLIELCGFVSGQFALTSVEFASWHRKHELDFTRRFVLETRSLHLADDGRTVKVSFSTDFGDDRNSTSDVHAQAMSRVTILRHLFPHRERFASEGVGLEVLGDLVPDNPTIKDIHREDLVEQRAVQFNAMVMALVSYRHRRVPEWTDYFRIVTTFRETVCNGFERLHASWESMLAEPEVKQKTLQTFPVEQLALIKVASELPMLPQVAVDEWGFVSEGRVEAGISGASKPGMWARLQKLKPWITAFGKFSSGVSSVAQRAEAMTVSFVSERNKLPGSRDHKDSRLLLVNLDGARQALESCQREFRVLLGARAGAAIDALDRREVMILGKLWLVAFAIANEPLRRRKDATRYLVAEAEERRRIFLDALQKEASAEMAPDGQVRLLPALRNDSRRRLWVVCNHTDLRSVEVRRKPLLRAIWRATQAPRWRQMEWAPLHLEWPELVVVHQVRGKAAVAMGTLLDTLVMFSSSEEFEIRPHHLIDVPILETELAIAGIQCWEIPLLKAVVTWQVALIVFVLTINRARTVVQLVEANDVPEAWLTHVEQSFKRKLNAGYDALRSGHENLSSLFKALVYSSSADAYLGKSWQSFIGDWPPDSNNGSEGTSTPVPPYVSGFNDQPTAFTAFVAEVADWAIAGGTASAD